MENKKRQFTQEFKKEAVEYSLASEKSVKEEQKTWVYLITTWTAGVLNIANAKSWHSPVMASKS